MIVIQEEGGERENDRNQSASYGVVTLRAQGGISRVDWLRTPREHNAAATSRLSGAKNVLAALSCSGTICPEKWSSSLRRWIL